MKHDWVMLYVSINLNGEGMGVNIKLHWCIRSCA